MCEHLEKAKGALDEARECGDGAEKRRLFLLDVASVQAQVSSAEALQRIADAMTRQPARWRLP